MVGPYHQDKIGSDLEKRLKISRSGEYWTWSITYDDLINESKENSQYRVSHFWNLFENVNQSFQALPDVLKLASKPTTEILESYLKGEEQPAWNEIPGYLSLGNHDVTR